MSRDRRWPICRPAFDPRRACENPPFTAGDNVQMVVTLINPIAMEEGLRFAIREGGRTVGAGVVAKIIK